MFHSRITAAVLAGTLVLGSAGIASADTGGEHGNHDRIAGTQVTVQNPKPTSAANNPFAIYREDHAPSNAGTVVASDHIASAKDYVQGFPGTRHDNDNPR